MSKPLVYVETTIPSFYYDFRDSPIVAERREITRNWWADAADRYKLVTSSVVLDELARGMSERVPLRLGLLQSVRTVPHVPQVAGIVQTYLLHKLMPAKPPEDALHPALASWHGCDFIVTWNCRHLANPNKATHIPPDQYAAGVTRPKAGYAQGSNGGNRRMSEEWTAADDVVEEVRQIRREIWAQFDNDPEKLIAYYTELDKQYADRMIDAPARQGKPAA